MGKRGPKPGGRPRGFMDQKKARAFQEKTTVQLESIAVGGPLDKVKVKASLAWDGVVRQFSDSHYVWQGSFEEGAWHWVPRSESHYPGHPSSGRTL